MKLSIAFFAAVSAVPSDFPLPDEFDYLQSVVGFNGFDNIVNCWFAYPNKPDYVAPGNGTFEGYQEPDAGYGNCGFQYKGESMTNATCTGFAPIPDSFAGTNLLWQIGNAAFVAKGQTIFIQIVGLDMS